ncbi:uncharacterized protein [Gossypium hirsutum]|uniref:RVP_2 domain-containing protein n=1 Tax=Gossypium hirsutum TaxID=3635 RepID=A0A1U8MZA3_GOSHI|nr:uncharacterized protein LOC107941801 [Gossypium hirsutum]
MVAMDYECCIRFEDGLRDSLRVLIAPQREQVFSELVEKEKIAEEVKRTVCLNRDTERGKNKREAETLGVGQRPRARVIRPVRAGTSAANPRVPPCADCGRSRGGKCWKRTGACLSCWSIEHRIRNCLKMLGQVPAIGRGGAQPPRGGQLQPRGRGNAGHAEARQPALVYAAHHREDGDGPDMIIGMFFIYEIPYTTLIDIGSAHSYVACNMTKPLGDLFEITMNEMTVISPLGQSVGVSKLFREVPLVVQGVTFLVDLMELPFSEFDLILGMDWLAKHRAILDCAAKRMVLRAVEDKEVVVIGERRNYLSDVITVLRAENNTEVKSPTAEELRIVREFPNVFPKELPRLPPNREVEFGIELLPDMTPVTIPPYRMAPKELVEHKA